MLQEEPSKVEEYRPIINVDQHRSDENYTESDIARWKIIEENDRRLWWRTFHRYCSMILLFITCGSSILLCPYTKVEESFNMQATYDILQYGYGPALFGTAEEEFDDAHKNNTNPVGDAVSPYDHLQYPGVVPRTFLGPIVLSTIVFIIRYFIYFVPFALNLFLLSPTKMFTSYDILNIEDTMMVQYMVRFVLMSLILYYGWFSLAHAVDTKLQQEYSIIGSMILYITSCQFHLPFYCSRLLPNTFALLLTLRAFTHWIYADHYREQYKKERDEEESKGVNYLPTKTEEFHINQFLCEFQMNCSLLDLLIGMLIFRCDLLLLLGCIGLVWWLFTKQITIYQSLSTAFFVMVTVLPFTIIVDSLMWNQYWLWPEAMVFYFNVILNKSSQYGISSYHWYFTSALPKALLCSIVFIPIGLFQWNSSMTPKNKKKFEEHSQFFQYLVDRIPFVDYDWISYFIPAIGFVLLYSRLGHKEIRFLFPVLPLFNLISAIGLYKLYTQTILPTNDAEKDQPVVIKENPRPPKSMKQKQTANKIYRYSMKFIYLLATMSLVASYAANWVFIMVSSYNYPGGHALQRLIIHVKNQQPKALDDEDNDVDHVPPQVTRKDKKMKKQAVYVYIDNAAAMTGVTLFLQHHATTTVKSLEWKFSKEGYELENQKTQNNDGKKSKNKKWWSPYTHIIMNSADVSKDLLKHYRIIHTEQGYPQLNMKQLLSSNINYNNMIQTSDAITVLQRNGSWNDITTVSSSQ